MGQNCKALVLQLGAVTFKFGSHPKFLFKKEHVELGMGGEAA